MGDIIFVIYIWVTQLQSFYVYNSHVPFSTRKIVQWNSMQKILTNGRVVLNIQCKNTILWRCAVCAGSSISYIFFLHSVRDHRIFFKFKIKKIRCVGVVSFSLICRNLSVIYAYHTYWDGQALLLTSWLIRIQHASAICMQLTIMKWGSM